MPTPLIEPIRWIAIGMAIANRKFAERLTNEVGPWAFSGPSWDGYNAIEGILAELPRAGLVLTQELGITIEAGEKLSDVVARVLKEEAEWAMLVKKAYPDQKRILELALSVSKDAAMLAAWSKRMKT